MKEYLCSKFQQNWVMFGGERAQKPPPKRDHFMDAALTQTFKICNLTTSNPTATDETTHNYVYPWDI